MSEQQAIFDKVEQAFGFVPNMIKTLTQNPVVANFYLQGSQILNGGLLSNKERQAVMLAVSNVNDCSYCSAAHGKAALGAGVSADDVQVIDSGALPHDARLSALVSAARLIVTKRGKLSSDDLASLEAAGVDRAQLHEIVAISALKVITNYIDQLEKIGLDPQFS